MRVSLRIGAVRHIGAALLGAGLLGAGCTRPQPNAAGPAGASTAPGTQAARSDGGTAAPTTGTGALPVAPVQVPPRPAIVKITIKSKPPKAEVFWGKKNLGKTPVILERPRDSTPLDLVVRAPGHFPVHTRAYTFRNDRLQVELTRLEDRMTLFGAKQELPPPEPPPGTPPETPPEAVNPAEVPPTPLVQPEGPLQ